MRRLLLLLATTALTLGAGLVAATPAHAAAPRCTSWSTYLTQVGAVHVPSAGYQTGRLDCVLKRGDRNDAVKVLQRALQYCHGKGYVAIDGHYGSNTHLGVWTLQNYFNYNNGAGLVEDGEFGPATRRWMMYATYFWPDNIYAHWCDPAPF
jgi:hypothetical protein